MTKLFPKSLIDFLFVDPIDHWSVNNYTTVILEEDDKYWMIILYDGADVPDQILAVQVEQKEVVTTTWQVV